MTPEQKKALKRRHGLVASVLAVMLLLTGTFAWTNRMQSAINPMWDETNHGGRIHDNFEGDLESRSASDWRNKDVYAENFGEVPLFVRIRLLEYLAFDEEPLVESWDIDDPMTWSPYRSQNENVHMRRNAGGVNLIGEEGVAWQLGHREEKIFMPTFNRATHLIPEENIGGDVPAMFAHINAFRMSDASGYGVEWFSNPAGMRDVPLNDRIGHASDFREHGGQSAPGLLPAGMATGDPSGLHNNWTNGQTFTSYRIHTPIVEPIGLTTPNIRELVVEAGDGANADNQYTHEAMPTMEPSVVLPEDAAQRAEFEARFVARIGTTVDAFVGVMTIHDWEHLGQPAGNFWIHDTRDEQGWFYWNGYLLPGEDPYAGITNATSLLLDEIYLPAFSRSWEYVILVDGEFFRRSDLDAMDLTEFVSAIFENAQLDEGPSTD